MTVIEFERKVSDTIEHVLSSEEGIVYSYEKHVGVKGRVSYDFFLPEGCRALDLPPKVSYYSDAKI